MLLPFKVLLSLRLMVLLVFLVLGGKIVQAQLFPAITDSPTVYAPDLLHWPTDAASQLPDLTEPTSNRIYDLHMKVGNCEAFGLIISTGGNYHMALTEYWYQDFLKKYPVSNWYFSTSPPISPEQVANDHLGFSNITLACPPHVAIGPKSIMDSLVANGFAAEEPIPLFTNYGNVLLVRKGNPKQIFTLADLARPDVRVATSNPYTETKSFGNYAQSIFQMALAQQDSNYAQQLFDDVFNSGSGKWIVGKRIHHREVPHLIYADQADVAPLFYHLAQYMVATFPETFEVVPLGGTVEAPDPLPGNKRGKFFVVPIKTSLTDAQQQYRAGFLAEIRAGIFDPYLEKHFLIPAKR
ncbi:MAG: substrate-binding domain-containing protein [Bacteroidota bacterium]